jgi:hypothetical protein
MEIHSRVLCSSSKASELLTRVAQQQQQTQDAGGGPGRYADALLGASFLVHSGEVSQILPICHNVLLLFLSIFLGDTPDLVSGTGQNPSMFHYIMYIYNVYWIYIYMYRY